MARFKKKFSKSSSPARSRFSGFVKRARRSGNKFLGGNKIIQPDAMIYGAVRGLISNKITPYLNELSPQTAQYNDNIAMSVASFAAAKYGSGMIKSVGQKGLTVENALVAADLTNALITGNSKPVNNLSW